MATPSTIHEFNRQFQQHEGQPYNAEDFTMIFFSSIFGPAFGSRAPPPRRARGHDIEIEVAVFTEETLEEHQRTISYSVYVYNAFGFGGAGNSGNIECENPGWRQQRATGELKGGRGHAGENGGPNDFDMARYPYCPASAL
ncbi:hypothetical protein KCP70_21620 [Salmonella enterica subsp. enterica]|nr:hypothetical protein KCP70_21620 [Salmonella enterica subsp. enterica]